MARYFTIARPNQFCDKGRVVREFDQGFELQAEVRHKRTGKCEFVGTNIVFLFHQLKDHVIPINLKGQFVYENGGCYAKDESIYHKNIFDSRTGRAAPKEPENKKDSEL